MIIAVVAYVVAQIGSGGVTILTAVVTALLSGGLVAAFVAFRKVGPEVESISVMTLKGVIAELRTEVSRFAQENTDLRAEVRDLRAENVRLSNRIYRLEQITNGAS